MLELTLEELNKVQKEALDKLVSDVGGVNHLSKMLNVHYTTIKGWIDRGRISKEGARAVEAHPRLGRSFKAIDLRPDL